MTRTFKHFILQHHPNPPRQQPSRGSSEPTRRSSRIVTAPEVFHEIDLGVESKEISKRTRKVTMKKFPRCFDSNHR